MLSLLNYFCQGFFDVRNNEFAVGVALDVANSLDRNKILSLYLAGGLLRIGVYRIEIAGEEQSRNINLRQDIGCRSPFTF